MKINIVSNEEIQTNFGSFGEIDTLAIAVNQNYKYVNISYRSLQDAIKALSACKQQGFAARCVNPNTNHIPYRPQQNNYQNNWRNGNNVNNNNSSNINLNHPQTRPSPQQQLNTSATSNSDLVLERLCDETYVPTQSWITDESIDLRYCRTISSLIQHFGGCMTISKLRGLLRQRLNAVGNIKSVPLKALLLAYPRFFSLNANLVILTRPASSNNNSNDNERGKNEYNNFNNQRR